MTQPQSNEENLTAEFRKLGQNLVDTLRTAWNRPERQKLQSELESGLKELEETLRRETAHLVESPTGQRIKEEVEDLRERIRSGQVEAKARQELLKALQTVNAELQKLLSRLSSSQPSDEAPQAPPPEKEATDA